MKYKCLIILNLIKLKTSKIFKNQVYNHEETSHINYKWFLIQINVKPKMIGTESYPVDFKKLYHNFLIFPVKIKLKIL